MNEAILPSSRVATARDYLALMKPRVMSLVVFTAFAGLVAAPTAVNPLITTVAVLAVALGSGAAGALNMWYDHDIDAVMVRTAARPIPAGVVPREEALALGLIVSAMAVLLMGLAANWLAAGLLAFSIFFYAVVYTIWLKRLTAQNIVIGGAAGAFPPVIGWVAATGHFALDAWLLFAIIFVWTPPHFWALSLWTSADYASARVPMLPVVAGATATKRQILIYALILAPLGVAPALTGLGGLLYGTVASGLGLVFVALAVRLSTSAAGDHAAPADIRHAHRLFGFSIVYLFVLFGVLVLEHVAGLYWPIGQGG